MRRKDGCFRADSEKGEVASRIHPIHYPTFVIQSLIFDHESHECSNFTNVFEIRSQNSCDLPCVTFVIQRCRVINPPNIRSLISWTTCCLGLDKRTCWGQNFRSDGHCTGWRMRNGLSTAPRIWWRRGDEKAGTGSAGSFSPCRSDARQTAPRFAACSRARHLR